MARPSPNTVDYFPHFAKTGKTKTVLKQKFGHVGIACWWELLETLASSENHYYDASTVINWHYLISIFDVSEELATEFLDLLATLGNIDHHLWTCHKVIWCQKFSDNISSVYAKRKKEMPVKPCFCDRNNEKCDHSRGFCDRNSTIAMDSDTEKRQSIVKDSIEKESKEKKDLLTHPLQKFVAGLKNVSKLDQQLTADDCERLIEDYDKSDIHDYLLKMENYKPLKKNNTSVNLTLRNWLGRDKVPKATQKTDNLNRVAI